MAEKHIERGRKLYHNFVDFKKAFDRVWHEGLLKVMRHFNIDDNIIAIIENIYKKTNSTVLVNNKTRTFFNTSVEVRQGCLLSPTLFNIFTEKIMQDTLEDNCSTITVGGCELCNLIFAADIDLMAG